MNSLWKLTHFSVKRFAISLNAFIHSCFIFFWYEWYLICHNMQHVFILSFSLMMTLLLKFQLEFTYQSTRMRIQQWLFISMEAVSHLEVLVSECTLDAGVYKKLQNYNESTMQIAFAFQFSVYLIRWYLDMILLWSSKNVFFSFLRPYYVECTPACRCWLIWHIWY